jgi:hypothetical protein
MADQTITPVALGANAYTKIVAGDYESLTVANQGIITPPCDGKYLLFGKVTAAGGATVTITHGDGFLSGQGDSVSAAYAQNEEFCIPLESSRFKWLSGADIGKIRITVTDAVSLACYQVP